MTKSDSPLQASSQNLRSLFAEPATPRPARQERLIYVTVFLAAQLSVLTSNVSLLSPLHHGALLWIIDALASTLLLPRLALSFAATRALASLDPDFLADICAQTRVAALLASLVLAFLALFSTPVVPALLVVAVAAIYHQRRLNQRVARTWDEIIADEIARDAKRPS